MTYAPTGFPIAEPNTVEEVFGGPFDGSFLVEASCPDCGGAVEHYMAFNEYGLSHRRCNAQCGGSYELVRPKPALSLFEGEHRWWENPFQLLRIINLGMGIESDAAAAAGDVPGLFAEVL